MFRFNSYEADVVELWRRYAQFTFPSFFQLDKIKNDFFLNLPHRARHERKQKERKEQEEKEEEEEEKEESIYDIISCNIKHRLFSNTLDRVKFIVALKRNNDENDAEFDFNIAKSL